MNPSFTPSISFKNGQARVTINSNTKLPLPLNIWLIAAGGLSIKGDCSKDLPIIANTQSAIFDVEGNMNPNFQGKHYLAAFFEYDGKPSGMVSIPTTEYSYHQN